MDGFYLRFSHMCCLGINGKLEQSRAQWLGGSDWNGVCTCNTRHYQRCYKDLEISQEIYFSFEYHSLPDSKPSTSLPSCTKSSSESDSPTSSPWSLQELLEPPWSDPGQVSVHTGPQNEFGSFFFFLVWSLIPTLSCLASLTTSA